MSPTRPVSETEALYAALFEALSSNSVLLRPDEPIYTIVAVTGPYLNITGTTKEELLGKGIFEAFPSNNIDPEHSGESDLHKSYKYVLEQKQAHYLPVQRYDLLNEDGSFEERYWRASNKPVFSAACELAFILHTAEDITDQIKAARRESQIEGIEKAYELFMQVPSVVGIAKGKDLILELANESAFQLWGKGPEILGRSLRETLPELEEQGIFSLFEKVLQTGEPYSGSEVPITTWRSGTKELRYFDLYYHPIFENANEGPVGVFTMSNDVTDKVIALKRVEESIKEQKLAENALRESEERFRSMADASPVMIWTLDEAGNSTYYNSKAASFTGHREEEIREGKSWQVAIHPDDIEAAGGVVQNAVVNRIPYQMECRMQRADGEWRWLLNNGTPRFGNRGEYFGFVGSSIDITEQKKSHQQLQTALEQIRLSKEAAELGTFDLDLEKGTMHWDDRCRTLFGISHSGVVTYEKDFVTGLHPEDRERITKVIERLFDKSVSNGDYDVEYRTVGAEDGVIRWVRAKGKVYFNEQDSPVRFIGSVLDITEKVTAIQRIEALVEERTKELAEANEALKNINNELERSNKNLEEFAHAASHDLKEPVRKIKVFTQKLKDNLSNLLDEEQAFIFSRIESANQRMGQLIDDLLQYSHVNHLPQETESVDLNKKVSKVLEDLEIDIEDKKATISVEELPVVKGYKRQIQQLFQNLISNALKYSKSGVHPVINISSNRITDAGKQYYQISIRDNGIGFDPAYASKIFQMFTRLHGRTEFSGSGVGLAIVKKVVENHNGFIEVESVIGEGSVFKICLPI